LPFSETSNAATIDSSSSEHLGQQCAQDFRKFIDDSAARMFIALWHIIDH
jgi:hypothetical protein